VGFDIPDTLRIVMRRESEFDRLAQIVGIAHEWKTQDERFDQSIYVVSDDVEMLQALSRNATLRNDICELLADPAVEALHCGFGSIWVDCKSSVAGASSNEDSVIGEKVARRLWKTLDPVRAQFEALQLQEWRNERDPAFRQEQLFLGIAALVGILGALAMLTTLGVDLPRPLVESGIVRHAGVAALATSVVLALALFAILGRTSRTHLVLLEIFLVAGPGAWLIGESYYQQFNQNADRAPPAEFVTRIAGKHYSRSRRSTSYYISVDHWPDTRIDRTLQVTFAVYKRLSRGQCVDFELHPGALGDLWLRAIKSSDQCADTNAGIGATGTLAAAPAQPVQPLAATQASELAAQRSAAAPGTLAAACAGYYPDDAKRRGQEGAVVLRFYVNSDGTVVDPQVQTSSGVPSLDEAAARCLQSEGHFEPKSVDGHPAGAWYQVKWVWRLTN
jgi:TonB family protein